MPPSALLNNRASATVARERPAAQPFVKWIGGKRSLLTHLHEHLPDSFNDYYEPFVGGGALFFSLGPRLATTGRRAVLSDNNFELVVAYQVIKKQPEALIEALCHHNERHCKQYYYRVREQQPSEPVDVAARFIYLNKTCYNGLYRVNKSGEFNAPMGSYKNPNIIAAENILACSETLTFAKIQVGDFAQLEPRAGDFVYLDPPYHPTDEQSFTQYTKENFTEKDQVRLRDYVQELHRRGVFVMLSNSKCRFVEDLYRAKHFNRHVMLAPRFVNCKANGRDKVQELLITNY